MMKFLIFYMSHLVECLKRFSPYLRYTLIFTAWNIVRRIVRCSEKFNQYYFLKHSQDKTYYNALSHVAHKLVRILLRKVRIIPIKILY